MARVRVRVRVKVRVRVRVKVRVRVRPLGPEDAPLRVDAAPKETERSYTLSMRTRA